MSTNDKKESRPHQEDIEQVRQIVFGQNNQAVIKGVKSHAREMVGEVFSEAMLDRQNQDGSVESVLTPIVESSIQKSLDNHSEKFIGYLYPLVGRLVRKSVSAFLSEFMEKTNALIESSLTIKGLKWRFRARQAGVSYAQYVASQTFVFRVEQVLLIHRETGLLLHSVVDSDSQSADADMVSGMLTAINDFVIDSFNTTEKHVQQNLNVVKTSDYNLVIKHGPQAVLVAAVKGSPPQQLADTMQETLETLHKLFGQTFSQFDGDSSQFQASEPHLRECLQEKLQDISEQGKKFPLFAWILVALFIAATATAGYLNWQQDRLVEDIRALPVPPGISILDVEKVGLSNVSLHLIRDPNALSSEAWLAPLSAHRHKVIVEESAFLSGAPALMEQRLQQVIEAYPELKLSKANGEHRLSGNITPERLARLQGTLASLPGAPDFAKLGAGVEVTDAEATRLAPTQIDQALLKYHIAEIESYQLTFESGSSQLTEQALQALAEIAKSYQQVIELAARQNLKVGLIIIGASDPEGNRELNLRLSRNRADATRSELIQLDIDPDYLHAIGLGAIQSSKQDKDSRKVLFSIVNFD